MTLTYDLAIGDRAYSSWSLRGWLLFDAFNIPVRSHTARLYTDELPELLKQFPPARTVPVMRTPDGAIVPETIAIAEELASRHPEAGLWPADPSARATARALAAEMHAGFTALRSNCPMNLRVAYSSYTPPAEVLADLARLDEIWANARATTGSQTEWLCGPYSAADAFFAPVAARIAAYGLPTTQASAAYTAAHLTHPSFRRWRAMGLVDGADQEYYDRDYVRTDWPARNRCPPPQPPPAPPSTKPAPTPANPSPISSASTAKPTASATPSAAIKPWPTRKRGRSSWKFTFPKPLRPSR